MRLPLRVLVLCTGNSARSQMAEALLNAAGGGRIVAGSAGTRPSPRVHPLAIATIERFGVTVPGHGPQGMDVVERSMWDVVITVCDNARDACPVFPGATLQAHWGMPDPTEAPGGEAGQRAAFETVFVALRAKAEHLAALPLESLDPGALRAELARLAR